MRLMFTPRIVCPAGQPIFESGRGSGCRCSIEGSSLLAQTEPTSLLVYCLDRYDACPTWREEKGRVASGDHVELAERQPDVRRNAGQWVRELGGEIEYEPVEYIDYTDDDAAARFFGEEGQ